MTSAARLAQSKLHPPAEPAMTDQVALQLIRDEHVRQGFATLELLEQLDPAKARTLSAEHLQAQLDQAAATLPVLRPVSNRPGNYDIMTTPTNQARLRRVLDVVMPGDRVLDIGLGYGYLACLLLRDAGIAGYVGIDLTESQVAATRVMAEVNGLVGTPMRVEVADLYDLTPEAVAEHDPDLLLLLEVLEHVPDAELALATLAGCMREDAAILFSVPVLGRLEKIWGHVSLFDATRVKAMCAQAGLIVQHVEVVQNSWTFVLATPTAAVPTRLLHLLRRPLPTAPPAAVIKPTFTGVDLGQVTGTGSATVTADADRVSATVRGSDRRPGPIRPGPARPAGAWQFTIRRRRIRIGRHELAVGRHRLPFGRRPGRHREQAAEPVVAGGLRFPVGGDERLRLELEFDDPGALQRVIVNLRDGRGRGTARWVWECAEGHGPKPGKQVYVLRPGRKVGRFVPVGMVRTGRAARAEVVIELAPGAAAATLTLYRAAAAGVADDD